MRKAFTMIELIFVIVVAGIIAAVALPRVNTNNLNEAADQVVSHIRYTQHLALQDNKFNPNERFWYKRRWTIRFFKNLTYTAVMPPAKAYNNIWAYSIYSDLPDFTGHQPDLNGLAINPQNPAQYLSGGYNNTLHVEDKASMSELRLNEKYGIQSIVFGGGCRANVRYIHFDNYGRPLNSFANSAPYQIAPAGWHYLLTSACTISLCTQSPCPATDGEHRRTIAIESETGFVHIL